MTYVGGGAQAAFEDVSGILYGGGTQRLSQTRGRSHPGKKGRSHKERGTLFPPFLKRGRNGPMFCYAANKANKTFT